MNELVLVTGGAGFIGSHTVDALLSRGYSVRILDNLQSRVHPRGRPGYLPRDAHFVLGDVADPADLNAALKDVDYVIHLAAYQDYLTDFSTFIRVNTGSTALLFELIVRNRYQIRKIVIASSQSVSGEGRYRCEVHDDVTPEPRPVEQLERGDWEVYCPRCGQCMVPLLIDEATCQPHTAYSISKYAVELLAKRLGARYGIPTACMRYTYVQGERNSFFNAYSGICRIFALRILQGLPPVCFEDGQQLRDYVNVRDVARSNLLAMEARAEHAVYNVGGGRAVTVLEFARTILDACGSSVEPAVPGVFRVGDTRHTVADISAMRQLGWEPTITVEQNVREYLAWMPRSTDAAAYLQEAEQVMRNQNIIRSVLAGQNTGVG